MQVKAFERYTPFNILLSNKKAVGSKLENTKVKKGITPSLFMDLKKVNWFIYSSD